MDSLELTVCSVSAILFAIGTLVGFSFMSKLGV